VPLAWTVKDNKGELLPRFIAGSPQDVVRSCYDAFRLVVSLSLPSHAKTGERRRNDTQLELKLN
jgi:hypothetical protein